MRGVRTYLPYFKVNMDDMGPVANQKFSNISSDDQISIQKIFDICHYSSQNSMMR